MFGRTVSAVRPKIAGEAVRPLPRLPSPGRVSCYR